MPVPYYVSSKQVMEGKESMPVFVLKARQGG